MPYGDLKTLSRDFGVKNFFEKEVFLFFIFITDKTRGKGCRGKEVRRGDERQKAKTERGLNPLTMTQG